MTAKSQGKRCPHRFWKRKIKITCGGIKRLYYADCEQTSYLGFVTIFSLVAYGE